MKGRGNGKLTKTKPKPDKVRHRNPWEVLANVVEACKEEQTLADLVRVVRQSWNPAKEFVVFALNNGLIIGDKTFLITKKGEDYVKEIRFIQKEYGVDEIHG